MSKGKKLGRNILLIVILFYLFLINTGLFLNPITAHKNSEITLHYGPSDIVHVADYEKGKYILGKYDKWVSCDAINRYLYILYAIGNGGIGFEIDKNEKLNYSWRSSGEYYRLYGIVNDNNIKKVKLTLTDGSIYEQTEFYDDLFLFYWSTDEDDVEYSNIKAYDADNNMIFEEYAP